MMETIQVYFTSEEKTKWMIENGFAVVDRVFTEYVSAYHNRTEAVKVTKPAVIIEDKAYMVDEVFKIFFEQQFKKVFTPVSLETQKNIVRIIKSIKNGRD